MRRIVFALVLLPTAALAGDRPPQTHGTRPYLSAKGCQNADVQHARRGQPVRLHPLGKEPPANQYLGVLRIENGCDRPVKIRENVGRDQR